MSPNRLCSYPLSAPRTVNVRVPCAVPASGMVLIGNFALRDIQTGHNQPSAVSETESQGHSTPICVHANHPHAGAIPMREQDFRCDRSRHHPAQTCAARFQTLLAGHRKIFAVAPTGRAGAPPQRSIFRAIHSGQASFHPLIVVHQGATRCEMQAMSDGGTLFFRAM